MSFNLISHFLITLLTLFQSHDSQISLSHVLFVVLVLFSILFFPYFFWSSGFSYSPTLSFMSPYLYFLFIFFLHRSLSIYFSFFSNSLLMNLVLTFFNCNLAQKLWIFYSLLGTENSWLWKNWWWSANIHLLSTYLSTISTILYYLCI